MKSSPFSNINIIPGGIIRKRGLMTSNKMKVKWSKTYKAPGYPTKTKKLDMSNVALYESEIKLN